MLDKHKIARGEIPAALLANILRRDDCDAYLDLLLASSGGRLSIGNFTNALALYPSLSVLDHALGRMDIDVSSAIDILAKFDENLKPFALPSLIKRCSQFFVPDAIKILNTLNSYHKVSALPSLIERCSQFFVPDAIKILNTLNSYHKVSALPSLLKKCPLSSGQDAIDILGVLSNCGIKASLPVLKGCHTFSVEDAVKILKLLGCDHIEALPLVLERCPTFSKKDAIKILDVLPSIDRIKALPLVLERCPTFSKKDVIKILDVLPSIDRIKALPLLMEKCPPLSANEAEALSRTFYDKDQDQASLIISKHMQEGAFVPKSILSAPSEKTISAENSRKCFEQKSPLLTKSAASHVMKDRFVAIPKAEYEALMRENAALKEENAKLKAENAKLQQKTTACFTSHTLKRSSSPSL